MCTSIPCCCWYGSDHWVDSVGSSCGPQPTSTSGKASLSSLIVRWLRPLGLNASAAVGVFRWSGVCRAGETRQDAVDKRGWERGTGPHRLWPYTYRSLEGRRPLQQPKNAEDFVLYVWQPSTEPHCLKPCSVQCNRLHIQQYHAITDCRWLRLQCKPHPPWGR
jgi:hypothetical protein